MRSFSDRGLPLSQRIVLRYVTECEARRMCGENADGTVMYGQDGRALEPEARRLSRLKAPLTDIELLATQRKVRPIGGTITRADVENNAFAKAFSALGPTDSIRALDRAEGKVDAWPEIYDEKAPVVCAGKVYGLTVMTTEELNATAR